MSDRGILRGCDVVLLVATTRPPGAAVVPPDIVFALGFGVGVVVALSWRQLTKWGPTLLDVSCRAEGRLALAEETGGDTAV